MNQKAWDQLESYCLGLEASGLTVGVAIRAILVRTVEGDKRKLRIKTKVAQFLEWSLSEVSNDRNRFVPTLCTRAFENLWTAALQAFLLPFFGAAAEEPFPLVVARLLFLACGGDGAVCS